MRKTFADVLKEGNINIRQEYDKLYSILHSKAFDHNTKSLYDIFDANFTFFFFRGTCMGIKDFDQKYGFKFAHEPSDFNLDYLVSFCEYLQNMVIGMQCSISAGGFAAPEVVNKILQLTSEQIRLVIDNIGYMDANVDGITIFVPKSQPAIVVSEILSPSLSYKVIEYNHHSMKGDLDKKQATLKLLADQLEAKKDKLGELNNSLKSDLFYLFNNINIRHNNIDPNSKSYKKAVAEMSKEELEEWYDRTYNMCLMAFMVLEQADNKTKTKELKDIIENSKK